MAWFSTSSTADEPATPQMGGTPPAEQKKGLLAWLGRAFSSGWPGPKAARGTAMAASLRQERIAGSPRGITMPQFLPYIDNITGESPATRLAYRRMLANSHVKAAFMSKILACSSLDLRIRPASKRSEKDRQIADFIRWMLTERLAGGVPGMIWSILSGGLVDGYSVCEMVWLPQETGQWAGKYALAALKPKDVDNDVILQQDEFRNVDSLLGLRYNPGTVYNPANYVIYSHMSFYGTPTGMSDFRAAYSSWWALETVRRLRLIGANTKSFPTLWGSWTTASDKSALETAMSNASSQNWLSVPDSVKLQVLEMAGASATEFDAHEKSCEHGIFMALCGATLQGIEGTTADGAGNTQVHRDTEELRVWALSVSIVDLLNSHDNGIVKNAVDLNFAVANYPTATLSAVDINETLKEAQLIDIAINKLGMKLSLEDTYDKLNLSPPHDAQDVLEKAPEQLQQQPGGGGDPPGDPGQGGGDPFGSQGPDEPELPDEEGPEPEPERFAEWDEGKHGLLIPAEHAHTLPAGYTLGDHVPLPPVAKHAEVRPLAQQTDFSCGPSSLRAVAAKFGLHVTEAKLRHLCGSDPQQGTPPEAMLAAAQALGLRAKAVERMSFAHLEQQLARDHPVIVCLQAIDSPAGGSAGGHWAVATAAVGDRIKLADPAQGTVTLSREELAARWHDVADSGRDYLRWGLIVGGRVAKMSEDKEGHEHDAKGLFAGKGGAKSEKALTPDGDKGKIRGSGGKKKTTGGKAMSRGAKLSPTGSGSYRFSLSDGTIMGYAGSYEEGRKMAAESGEKFPETESEHLAAIAKPSERRKIVKRNAATVLTRIPISASTRAIFQRQLDDPAVSEEKKVQIRKALEQEKSQ